MVREFVINRLKEPSTWVGIVSIAGGVFGFTLSNDVVMQISGAIAMLVGAFLAARKDANAPDAQQPSAATPNPTGDHDRGADPKPPIGDARDIFRHRNDR